MRNTVIALAFIAILACGCSTTQVKIGKKISAADINGIEKGTTTRAEIIGKFGAPASIMRNSEGVEAYVFVELGQDNHMWLVPPLFNIYISGAASSCGKVLVVAFKDDIVQNYSYTVNSTMGAAEAGSTSGFSGATLPDD
ncbi:MAG: hypothetical protein ACYS8W_05755 [Planctomycetota bacterium]|jgi:hypothetical protein